MIACVYSDNIVTVARYYNEGNEPVYSNSSNGVSNGTVTLSDGQISCSVRRLIQLASDAKFYSLDSEYYLLASTGLTDSSGDLQYHGPNRVFSNSEINFLADSSSSGQTTDPNKVKAHSNQTKQLFLFFSLLDYFLIKTKIKRLHNDICLGILRIDWHANRKTFQIHAA